MAPPQAITLSLISPLLTLLLRMPSVRQFLAKAGGHSPRGTKAAYASRVWVDGQLGERKIRAQMVGGEGLSTAADIALHAVDAALLARPKPGGHTPATAFGPEFLGGIPGIAITFAWHGPAVDRQRLPKV